MARLALAVVAIALVGCYVKPDSCVDVTPVEHFSDANPCGTGSSFGATVTSTGGQLVVTPPTNAMGTSAGGCSWIDDFPAGVFVEVLIPTGMSTYTELNVATATHHAGIGAQAGDGAIRISVDGMLGPRHAYDATAMRWWRLRDVNGVVVADVAPDATTWQVLDQVSVGGDAFVGVTVAVNAGTFDQDPSPGAAVFAHFNWCL